MISSRQRKRYCPLLPQDQDHLVGNIVNSLSHATPEIQKRMVGNLKSADADLGKRVEK
jgi:catalase